MDLDFLVALEHAPLAAQVLNAFGYTLHAISKGTWEFKVPSSDLPSTRDLYRRRPQRSVELHMARTQVEEHARNAGVPQLDRAIVRPVCGVLMPVLAPPDQFLSQAIHIFGHLRSEFTRMSWGLEFIRHIRCRASNAVFWREVSALAEDTPEASTALGVSILLAEEIFGSAVPRAVRAQTFAALPPGVAGWATRYGRRALLSDFPGSKLYLLLERELSGAPHGAQARSLKRLLPRRLPPMITQSTANESFRQRSHRYQLQLSYLCFRTAFHAIKGLQYAVERTAWHSPAQDPSE
jgi:hypothetical protein